MDADKISVIELCGLQPLDVYAYLELSPKGLSKEAAEIRGTKYGKNTIPRASVINPLKQLIKQFTHFMAVLLWIAGFLAIIAGMPELALATWAVIVINALFAFFQEFKADKALTEIAHMLPNMVKVIRNNERTIIHAEEVTLGDLIILDAGDRVPADARVVEAEGLSLDNSLLTGESLPVDRNEQECNLAEEAVFDSTNLIFAGTKVVMGSALAVVYAIGGNTEIGKLSGLTQTIVRGESNLEVQVQQIVKFITKVSLVLGAIAFSLAVFGVGLSFKVGVIFAIGVTVANIPEGLLPTVSLSLATGVQRMAKRKVLVRRLAAVEALSAVSVICTDKTGTITENQLTVRKIWTPDTSAQFEGRGFEKKGGCRLENQANAGVIGNLLKAAVVCSDTDIAENKENPLVWKVIGSSTEAALLIAAKKFGLEIQAARGSFQRIETIPFSSEKKMMSVIAANLSDPGFPPDAHVMFTKGGPVEVLQTCRFISKNGIPGPIDEQSRNEIIAENDRMAAEGYRVLGVACQLIKTNGSIPSEGNVFLGLAAMEDPPRPEVYRAFSRCVDAGIKINIITGDYGITAAAIARQLGLNIGKQNIITGHDLEQMTDENLSSIIRQNQSLIFSRTTPMHKLRIVEAYKKNGEIVAVTGDGVNDTLALKSSHIGIAMGVGGTDVAREAADMILLDNNFATIVKGVEEGRAIYSNIRKFLTYIMSSNVPQFFPFVAMVLGRIPPALNILQILAIDLGTDLVPALGLGAEKPEKSVLENPPAKYRESILNRSLFLRAYGFLGFIEGIIAMAVFFYVWRSAGYGLADMQALTNSIMNNTASKEIMHFYQYSSTMAFVSIVACQFGNLFICRSESHSLWSMLPSKNSLIYIGLVFEVILTACIVFIPALSQVFQTQPIGLGSLKIIILCPIILIIFEEGRKYISRRWFSQNKPGAK